MQDLFAGLNANQQQAVAATDGPLLLLAGAGSGKTRVLTHRIAHLIDTGKAQPDEVLAVTFTNRAAKEMQSRLRTLMPGVHVPWVMTFHGLCVRILRSHGSAIGLPSTWTIVDSDDSRSILRQILTRGDDEEAPEAQTVRDWQRKISWMKNTGVQPGDIDDPMLIVVWQKYQESLRAHNALDFDDLLLQAAAVLDTKAGQAAYGRQFKYISVDEYQDTNSPQEAVLVKLAHHQNVCVIGDESQAIYSFRGSQVDHILKFRQRWPKAKTIILEENYRSTGAIVQAANTLISHNTERTEKISVAVKDTGKPVIVRRFPNSWMEAEMIANEIANSPIKAEQTALIYRTNSQSRVLEEALTREAIPYHVVGGVAFLQRAVVKTARAYLQLLVAPDNVLAFKRAIISPRRGVGDAAQQVLLNWCETHNRTPLQGCMAADQIDGLSAKARTGLTAFGNLYKQLLGANHKNLAAVATHILQQSGYLADLEKKKDEEALGNLSEFVNMLESYTGSWVQELPEFLEYATLGDVSDQSKPGVQLMTIHATKGLEFPAVYVVGLEDTLFFHGQETERDVEEGRRLLYVAMTRAEQQLVLSHCDERMQWGRTQRMRPLRFLNELPSNVERRRVSAPKQSRSQYGNQRPQRRSGASYGTSSGSAGRSGQRSGATQRSGGNSQQRPARSTPAQRGQTIVPAPRKKAVKGPPQQIRQGALVRHPKFGDGVVAASDDGKVTVAFDDRKRTLDTRIVQLQVLG